MATLAESFLADLEDLSDESEREDNQQQQQDADGDDQVHSSAHTGSPNCCVKAYMHWRPALPWLGTLYVCTKWVLSNCLLRILLRVLFRYTNRQKPTLCLCC